MSSPEGPRNPRAGAACIRTSLYPPASVVPWEPGQVPRVGGPWLRRWFGDRFRRELGNMSTISQLKGMSTMSGVKGNSGKPYRRLPITSANVTIISQNNKLYTIV